jgi:hypothetical protein
MATFNGFQKDDFDAFLYIEEDSKREIRNIVKNKFKLYLDELFREIKKNQSFEKFEYSVGKLHKDSKAVWGIICKPPMETKVQRPQFHFSLNRNRFQIGVMIEGIYPAKRMKKNIKNNPEGFYRILRNLDGFILEIENKVSIDNIPKKFRHYPVVTVKLGKEINREDIFYIISKTSLYVLLLRCST